MKFWNYFIENTTPYIGTIKLKFDKYPHWSGSGSILNKIHFDLGFTKLTSRLHTTWSKNRGRVVDDAKVLRINQETGGKIKDHTLEHPLGDDDTFSSTLHNSFVAPDGTYIGNIEIGWWYVKNGFKVCDDYPHGCAEVWEDGELVGYYGYSHRGGTLFKVGDRLFDDRYEPAPDDYEPWQWDGWVMEYEEAIEKAKKEEGEWWYSDIYHDGISRFIPFTMRGPKEIENLEEAKRAAINMSMYLS